MTERERQTEIRKERDKAWQETINSKEHKEATARIKNVNLDEDEYDERYERMKARHGMMRSTLRDRHYNS